MYLGSIGKTIQHSIIPKSKIPADTKYTTHPIFGTFLGQTCHPKTRSSAFRRQQSLALPWWKLGSAPRLRCRPPWPCRAPSVGAWAAPLRLPGWRRCCWRGRRSRGGPGSGSCRGGIRSSTSPGEGLRDGSGMFRWDLTGKDLDSEDSTGKLIKWMGACNPLSLLITKTRPHPKW